MSTPFDTAAQFVPDSPNEDPLSNSGQWTSVIYGQSLRRNAGMITTHVTMSDAVPAEMLWNPMFFTDGAVCMKFNNSPVHYTMALKLRASSDGQTGYRGYFTGPSGTWVIYKDVAGVETSLLSGAGPDLNPFDRFGLSVIGSTIKMWKQARIESPLGPSPLASNWSEVLSVTDTSITGAGYFTLYGASVELELYETRGGPMFPVGGGGGSTFGPGSPTFNVRIRSVTSRP